MDVPSQKKRRILSSAAAAAATTTTTTLITRRKQRQRRGATTERNYTPGQFVSTSYGHAMIVATERVVVPDELCSSSKNNLKPKAGKSLSFSIVRVQFPWGIGCIHISHICPLKDLKVGVLPSGVEFYQSDLLRCNNRMFFNDTMINAAISDIGKTNECQVVSTYFFDSIRQALTYGSEEEKRRRGWGKCEAGAGVREGV